MTWDWKVLCGNTSRFTVWKGNDFGVCFERLALNIPTTFFILAVTLFHFGKNFGSGIRGTIPCSPTLHIRFYATVGLLLCCLLNILLQKFYLKNSIPLILVISTVVSCVTWFIHGVFIWNLRRYYRVKISGPFIITIGIILKCAFYVIKFRSVIKHVDNFTIVEKYVTYAQGILIAVYLLSLIPCQRPVISSGIQVRILNEDSSDYLESDEEVSTIVLDRPTPPLGKAQENCSLLSRLTFHWVQSLMARGASRKIENFDDLYCLPKALDTFYVEESFKSRRMGQGNEKRSLLATLNRTFGKEFYPLGILKFTADILGFLGPLLLNWLVIFMEKPKEPRWHGYIYASGLFLTTLFTALLTSHFNYLVNIVSLKMRASLISAIYEKALKTSTVSLSNFNTGQIVNYMSTDVDRIVNFCISFHQFWSLPFQIAVSLWLLYLQVGFSFLAGLAFAIVLIPLNRYLANAIGRLSNAMMEQKDARVKLMSEILHGIRIIKFYAWEDVFTDKISNLRSKELKSLKGRKYLDAFCVYFWATTPVLISILTFTTYALTGHELTAARVFTSLALFNMLISPLNAFPWVLNGLMEAWVSLKRVQEFDNTPEKDWESHYKEHNNPTDIISIENASFLWNKSNEEAQNLLKLENISFTIKEGSFIGLTGPVGSGKSSLFSAILGEMEMTKGHLSFSSKVDGISFQTQEPWIQHGTVQENILFGNEMNDRFYHRVLDACSLLTDLQILPGGDETEIGENGVTLSGGQKARISLARAVYQNKDIIFLDDPFAAVDSHVAKHIHSQCIMGLLSGKTRFISTHHTKFLRNADMVIVLKDGKIDKIGKPCDVLEDQPSINDSTVCKDAQDSNSDDVNGNKEDGILVKEEAKEKGVVRLSIYIQYCKAVGYILTLFILLSMFLMQASKNVNDWWLSFWVTHSKGNDSSAITPFHENRMDGQKSRALLLSSGLPQDVYRARSFYFYEDKLGIDENRTDHKVKFYLTIYGILAGLNSIFTLLRAFLFAYGGIQAAKVLHNHLLKSILSASIHFFDTTPVGRIINRFSSDVYSIDDSLPFIANILLAQVFSLIGTLIITCYGLPLFGIVIVPIAVIYYTIQRYYRHTSREVKRITSITLSPIYVHFSETLRGLNLIRAMRHVSRFQEDNRENVERNQRGRLAMAAVSVWLGFRLQLLGVAMLTSVALFAVIQHQGKSSQPGLVGLALSYALAVTNILSGAVTSFTQTEQELVAVERACQYIENAEAEQDPIETDDPPRNWPSEGSLVFDDVFANYRHNLPDAIKNVSLSINGGEKIGIVGRTGAGKSSLFLILYRLLEIRRGSVKIDGVDITTINRRSLRKNLSIIPQDPFLFSTSVRDNLDAEGQISDQLIWSVLERCQLKSVVERLGGLSADVGEGGKNLSVGEKQLLCLARALLTNSKIICIDEATASVDSNTDRIVHSTLREEFKNRTILTIAHRLNTIMDSDRVLVMDEATIKEFDNPQVLSSRPNSLFSNLSRDLQPLNRR